MKLREDVIGQRRRLAKYIKRLQRFRRFLGDFSANLLR
jgi:ribosomal protein S15P/S13E